MERPSGGGSWAPGLLVALLLLALVGAPLWIEVQARKHRGARLAGEARAEAELERRARAYADAVLADSGAALTDGHLLAIAEGAGVEVREIHRAPELSVVVRDSQGHGPGPLPGLVVQCRRITFRHPGAAAAAQVELLPRCPAGAGVPIPSGTAVPTPSGSGS